MIYIVIPVHNRIEKTIKCLNSIYMQNENDIQIVVVDDGSNDGTKQILQEKYPETTCNTPKRLNNLKVENSIIKQQGVFYGRIKI